MAKLSKLSPASKGSKGTTPKTEHKLSLHLTKRLIKATKKLFTTTKKENDRRCLQAGHATLDSLPADAVIARPCSTELPALHDTSEAKAIASNAPLAGEACWSDSEVAIERSVEQTRQGGDKTVGFYGIPAVDHSDWLSTVLTPEMPKTLAQVTPAILSGGYGVSTAITAQGSTSAHDQRIRAQPVDLSIDLEHYQRCQEALRASLEDLGATAKKHVSSGEKSNAMSTGKYKAVSESKPEVENLEEKSDTTDREQAVDIGKLEEMHESSLKAAFEALETVNWKHALAENRLKVVVEEKEASDRKNQDLFEKQEDVEAMIKSKDDLNWANQTLQQRFDDLQVEHDTKCQEALQTAEVLIEKDKIILELRARVSEATNELFNVSQFSQDLAAANHEPGDGQAASPDTGRDQPAGTIDDVKDNSDPQPSNQNLDWAQPNHGTSMEQGYQESAEQCKALQAELNNTIIERDALAMAAVEVKRESDWWFAEDVWWEEENRQNKGDFQQQLVYKDRLLIDLNKRVDKGMTDLREAKKRSCLEKGDMAEEISSLKEKLEIATSDLFLVRESKESVLKGYRVTLEMLKNRLYQNDITDAISYYYDIVSSDNTVLAQKVEFQAANLERSREEGTLKDLRYRDLSRTSAKQLVEICELQSAKRSLEVELGRLEAEAVIGAQERKEEVERYEQQLQTHNAEYNTLGEKVQKIIRLEASDCTKAELDQKDETIQRLKDQLWHAERRVEHVLEKERVRKEAQASDLRIAVVQDAEYDLYKMRLFAAEAEVTALKAGLADKDKMLDGSNPLHLKEASVYRQALETAELDRRELEEKLAEESSLVRQQLEAKINALEALGTLLWTRSRNLKATLDAHGHDILEESSESEDIDAACRTLFGIEDDGSEAGPVDWTEDGIENGRGEGAGVGPEDGAEEGPVDGAMDMPDEEVGGASLVNIGPGEHTAVEDGANGAPNDGSGHDTLSASHDEDLEDGAESEGANDSGVEDDDRTIRPQYPSTRAPGHGRAGNAEVEDGRFRLQTYPRETQASSWWATTSSKPWTSREYAELATLAFHFFPFAAFAATYNKTEREVFDTFSAIISLPIFQHSANGLARAKFARWKTAALDKGLKDVSELHRAEARVNALSANGSGKRGRGVGGTEEDRMVRGLERAVAKGPTHLSLFELAAGFSLSIVVVGEGGMPEKGLH